MLAHLLGLSILFVVAAAFLCVVLLWNAVIEVTHPPRRTLATALARGQPGDPADLGYVFTSWTIERLGIELPVWDVEGRDPAGIVAVFVHDWGSGRVEMLEHLETWAPWSRRMLLYDRRGHGDADGSAGLGAGEEDDLTEIVNGAGGDGPVVFVGDSIGALIAIRAAAKSDGVSGMVAFAPPVDARDAIRRRHHAAGLPSRPFLDLALAWVDRGKPGPPILDIAASLPGRSLVIHGEDERFVPVEAGRRIAEAAGASHVLVRGGLPSAPEVRAAIEAFLRDGAMIP